MSGLSNYPPGVSGNEPEIIGGDDHCACGEPIETDGIGYTEEAGEFWVPPEKVEEVKRRFGPVIGDEGGSLIMHAQCGLDSGLEIA